MKNEYGEPVREPVFNLPGSVTLTVGILVGIHVVLSLIDAETAQRIIIDYAFIPARAGGLPTEWALYTPEGPGWSLLTMVTHAGLHGNYMHLGLNCLWLLAFGSPVARAIGMGRYFFLFLLCAIGGALAFWSFNPGGLTPVVGASGAISGMMAASLRFMFAMGPLGQRLGIMPTRHLAPLNSRRFLGFTAAWLGINLVFGLAGSAFSEGGIAWEAHMGGYFVGALLVGFLLPRPRRTA